MEAKGHMAANDPALTESDGATVFLSYSRDDQKRAQPVISALENAGFKVWWDGLLQGGDSFLPTTEAALEGADAVVVLWSKTSIGSHWVRDEATVGRDRRRLVPLSLDGSDPPLGFRQFQVIDISKWHGRADALEMQRVTSAIAALSGREVPKPVKVPRTLGRRELIAGGVALAAVGGGLAYWKFGLPGGVISEDSIAVLPFQNLSGDPGQSYFSDGLSEEIRLGLSRNEDLRVLAPMSAGKAQEEYKDVSGIAKALGAAYLLRGSVRRSGDNLRIAAELFDVKSPSPVWSAPFNRTMTDIFAVQEEIADAVSDVLSAQMAGFKGKATSKDELGGTENVRAYDAYLRGNAYYALGSGEASDRASLKQYEAALAIDSDYAQAHAARARVITVITNSYAQASEFKERYDEAVASAKRAVAIAPKLAIAQSTLGFVLVQGRLDLRGARAPYEISYKLGRGDATVQMLYAAYAAEMGWPDQALKAVNRAVELDPLNAATQSIYAFVDYCGRRFDAAIGASKRALALNPKLVGAHAHWGKALLQKGQLVEALAVFQKEPDQMSGLTGLAIAFHQMSNFAAADAAVDSLKKQFGDGSTYQQAQILAQWYKPEEAMQKLILARKIGDVGLAMAGTDPLLDPLRDAPEFSNLLKELGFG
jgi:TolB-like protein/Tfp pilus assembly protein PilF